jgi:antibiotic biosynthesis monooxygenase (ABM) superfamily enzyme
MMAKPDGKYSCGCGRSPTGSCIGWHALTEEAYQSKSAEWNQQQQERDRIEREKTLNDELDAYRQQAMELWFDNGGSCTGDRKSSA